MYRSTAYHRMRRNVTELVEKNATRDHPLPITIALRPDRPLADVLKDPDFQPILTHHPRLDFTWAFGLISGRVTLPSQMTRRIVRSKPEACVQTYNGLMVLADGAVMGCGCVAAMDAQPDLVIGHVMNASLLDIWRGEQVRRLRKTFRDGSLNKTCTSCDIYRNLDLYRTFEGRTRARLNRRRSSGDVVRRATTPSTPFAGG